MKIQRFAHKGFLKRKRAVGFNLNGPDLLREVMDGADHMREVMGGADHVRKVMDGADHMRRVMDGADRFACVDGQHDLANHDRWLGNQRLAFTGNLGTRERVGCGAGTCWVRPGGTG